MHREGQKIARGPQLSVTVSALNVCLAISIVHSIWMVLNLEPGGCFLKVMPVISRVPVHKCTPGSLILGK